MGSWKGSGNQYIQFVRVLYCKLLTNGKQLPAFPLGAGLETEPRPQRWEARVLPLCHQGPLPLVKCGCTKTQSPRIRTVLHWRPSDVHIFYTHPLQVTSILSHTKPQYTRSVIVFYCDIGEVVHDIYLSSVGSVCVVADRVAVVSHCVCFRLSRSCCRH